MTAAELFIKDLQRRGVEWIATLCGHGLDPLLNAARQAGMRLVDVRNEQTCAYIADAFGRLTRRPGVCAVSSGVAHLNALTGVANAWFDRAPMLLISGAGATVTAGKGHFQDLDQVALARPITKLSASIDDASRTAALLDESFRAATADPPGPVHLMFPMDMQEAEAREIDSAAPTPAASNPPDLREIAAALAEAEAPLVIAGSGVFYNGSGSELLLFCTELSIPVVTPIWDRGVVNQPSPVFLGVIGAATGGPAVLSEADCILMAGAAVDYRVGYLEPPAVRTDARIFQVSGWDPLVTAGGRKHDAWLARCRERRRHPAVEPDAPFHGGHVVGAIQAVLNEDPVLLVDGGSIGQWVHQVLCRDRYPSDWLTCGRSGVVGWGIGGAMAARLAFPQRPVILISGDGAFTFNVAELESAARQRLPFVAIVADDQAWGITRLGQIQRHGAPTASLLGPIAFDRLAESLGARGVHVSSPNELTRELRRAIAQPVVTVIHAPIAGSNP